MAIPVAATAATLAYLNAKWRIPVDVQLIGTMVKAIYTVRRREKQDRMNSFYFAEENALNAKVADKLFLLFEERSLTFKQFYDLVLHYAGWLHSTHNVARGEVVAIDYMNSPELLILTVAVWSLGALPALINYNLTGDPLAHSLRTSSARLLIIEPEVANSILNEETKTKLSSPTFRNNTFPLEIVVLDQALQTSVEHFKPYRAPDSARSGAEGRTPSVLISTSGTTGLPKQAIVPCYRLIGGGLSAFYNCRTRPVTSTRSDVFYTAMPLYHGTAFVGGFGFCLGGQATLAIGRKFSSSKFWQDARLHKVTIIQYVGEALRYLLAAPERPDDKNHQVRLAYGNGCRPDVWNEFKARFNIPEMLEFYSATEGTFATWNANRNDFSDGAVGQSGKLGGFLLSRRLSIVKLDWEQEIPWRDPKTGLCHKVARGELGELLAKLDPTDPRAQFPGYYNNEKATEQKILRDVHIKGDAYFRTGDVVRWDSEGRFWFSDRIGDTFRWKSENVSTMEVGEALGYHPEVLEANVYGVSVPGHEGRAGCAALLLKDSAMEEGSEGRNVKAEVLKSLARYARKSLQKASVPVFVRVVKEMNATGNNKSLKHNLRTQGINLQAIENAGSGDQLYWLQPTAERYVKFEPQHWDALGKNQARL